MDYFNKLKRRPLKAQPTAATQLTRFHQSWERIHRVFTQGDRQIPIRVEETEMPRTLREMTDLLVDEEAREDENTTGPCMEYFLKNGILQYLVDAAEKEDYPTGLRGETIRTVASMINWLSDRFLVHHAVHKPTVKLLRFCVFDGNDNHVYSDDLVDLMYSICSKIQGYPALLNIFFYDKYWLTTPQKMKRTASYHDTEKSKSNTSEPTAAVSVEKAHDHNNNSLSAPSHDYEFLLFTYLLRFVHREGRSGDYARTGLLFLLEMAKDQLGDFILHSDFVSIVAAGVGATYSQLPRKLIMKGSMDDIQTNSATYLLNQHDWEDSCSSNIPPEGTDAEYSTSIEFRHQVNAFLKALEFCQDVLMRCPNKDIRCALLANVRSVFVENILYPSALECSDVDGSAVAVISYIDLILKTVEQEDLSEMIVGFLMEENQQQRQQQQKFFTSVRLLENKETNDETKTIETVHFTLKNLILSRLKSKSQATSVAALKLLRTLVTKHCTYALTLLATFPELNKHPAAISHHLREVELYYSLISNIDGQQAKQVLSQGYGEYLRDVQSSIENDSCCMKCTKDSLDNKDSLLMEKTESENVTLSRRRSFKYGQRNIMHSTKQQNNGALEKVRNTAVRHRISKDDPLLQTLRSLFTDFFKQSTEMNLALTGVISALALCPNRSLEGWISFSDTDRSDYDGSENVILKQDASKELNDDNGDGDEEDDCSVDFNTKKNPNEKTKPTFFKSYPVLFTVFRTLTQQVNAYRTEIADFDTLLRERREALLTGRVSFAENTPVNTHHRKPFSNSTTKRLNPSLIAANLKNAFFSQQDLFDPVSASDVDTLAVSMTTSATLTASTNDTLGDSQHNIPPAASSAAHMNTILKDTLSPLSQHIKKIANTHIKPSPPAHFTMENAASKTTPNVQEAEFTHTKPVDSGENSTSQPVYTNDTETNVSTVLNNIVIFEEAVKEIVALLQVRRSMGVDAVAYT